MDVLKLWNKMALHVRGSFEAYTLNSRPKIINNFSLKLLDFNSFLQMESFMSASMPATLTKLPIEEKDPKLFGLFKRKFTKQSWNRKSGKLWNPKVFHFKKEQIRERQKISIFSFWFWILKFEADWRKLQRLVLVLFVFYFVVILICLKQFTLRWEKFYAQSVSYL